MGRYAALGAMALLLTAASCDEKAGSPKAPAADLAAPEPPKFGANPKPQSDATDLVHGPQQKDQSRVPMETRTPPPALETPQRKPAFDTDAARLLSQARSLPDPPLPKARPLPEPANGECRPVPGVGCLIQRPGAERVLVYMRGHLTRDLPSKASVDKANVPSRFLAESAADAVEQYGLRKAAERLNAVLLVTGSSHVALDAEKLRRVGIDLPDKIVVAAHSGGVVGLNQSLPKLPKLEGVVLLDPYYGVGRGGAVESIAKNLAGRVSSGEMKCGGFYTPPFRDKKGRVRGNTRAAYQGTFAPAMGPAISKCPSTEAPSHSAGHSDHILRVMQPPGQS